MKHEDTIIYYRPELAHVLEKIINNIIYLYEKNQKGMMYHFLSICKDIHGDTEGAALLRNASQCLLYDTMYGHETFNRDYREDVNQLGFGQIGNISEASAARFTFYIYELSLQMEKSKIDMSDFTKFEIHTVNRFFNMLLAPAKNPNIQIHEGHHKCHYDTCMDSSFTKDTQMSIDYIKRSCAEILEYFTYQD